MSVWNYQKNNLFFMIRLILWNIRRIYYFFLIIQNIKGILFIIFLKISSNQLFLMEDLFLPVVFIYKNFNFWYFCGAFMIFSWFNATFTGYSDCFLCFLLIEFIIALFVFRTIRWICIWSTAMWIYFIRYLKHWMNKVAETVTTFHRF